MASCRICGKPIPDARAALNPRIVTCGMACSAENTRRLGRAAQTRYRKRMRKQKGK